MPKKRWIPRVTGVAAAAVLPTCLTGAAAAIGPTPALPTVSSFVATPSSLSSSGGIVTLSVNVTNATSCKFTSNRPVVGLPGTIPCSNGTVDENVTVPADSGWTALTYKMHVAVAGSGGSGRVRANLELTVPSGIHIVLGTPWTLRETVLPMLTQTTCSIQTFVSHHRWVDDSGYKGTYTGGGPDILEPIKQYGAMGGTWNEATNEFEGGVGFSGGLLYAVATLSPGATPGC